MPPNSWGHGRKSPALCSPWALPSTWTVPPFIRGVCAIFIAQIFGIELTIAQQLTIILTATLASIGTAGVPGSGMIMLTMVLETVGLPVEGIALVAGIDRILDMGRTTVNITGDATCTIVVDAWEKRRERKKMAAQSTTE